jgi:hypothetical protein
VSLSSLERYRDALAAFVRRLPASLKNQSKLRAVGGDPA